MKRYLFFISIIMLSCQEEITLDLPQAVEKLVVEGAIEPGFPPYVILTKNQGYFDPISENPRGDIIVNDADTVKIWYYKDGVKRIRFLEQIAGLDSLGIYSVTDYNFDPDPDSAPIPYDFSEAGSTYYLEIKWNNKLITAETTIPIPTALDCLWVEKSETAEEDYMYDIRAVYSDDGNIQNNILIKSKLLEHWELDSISGNKKKEQDSRLFLLDAGSDVLINGESFETYFPKPKESSGFPSESYNTAHDKIFDNNGIQDTVSIPHDVVLIKFCQIDEPSLKFWRGVVRQFTTNGNPFSEPSNLATNINGGLGAFTGYGAVYYEVDIIKDITIYTEYPPGIMDIF